MRLNTQRGTANLHIINLFKQKAAPHHSLKLYSGWGGLRAELYTPEIHKELDKLLTPEEFSSLKKTVKSAYYTPATIVQFMYDWLVAYGFKGGAVLEPAAGNGIFIEYMPPAMKEKSHITTVELDLLTGQMLQKLYPDVTHHTLGFEQYQPDATFDLVIGNPPYSAEKVFDEKHTDLKEFCIHHYFVAKSMRLLKSGGILAMVLPSYFLDNVKDHVRDIIHQEGGELLAAYRLPDDLFTGAKVTVDVVFLTKGPTHKKWLYTKDVFIAGLKKPMNEYFHSHSHNILGNLEIINMYERKGLTCRRRGDIFRLLKQAVGTIKQARFINLTASLAKIDQEIESLQTARLDLISIYNDAHPECRQLIPASPGF